MSIPGLDPCGVVMDTIKHEFQGSIRPYYDRPDISIPVQWYRTQPGAKWIDTPTCFANVLDFAYPRFRPNVGINYVFKPNSVGNQGNFAGQKVCGTPDAFLYGVSYYQTYPDCKCARGAVVRISEVPLGAVNWTNREFTCSQLPLGNNYLDFYINGVRQDEGVNYSLVGPTIRTMADSTPRVGDTVWVTYWVQP